MSSPTYAARLHAAAHTSDYLYQQLIPYLGNKRKLLPSIARAVARTGATDGTFVDLFAGSGVVSRWAKRQGFRVIANDWEPYAEAINRCHIGCNTPPEFRRFGGLDGALAKLNAATPEMGYITTHLCPGDDLHPLPDRERLFFTRANGMKMDAVREKIACWEASGWISDDERAVLLAPLLYAASYVSNTSGVFKGFHHGWGGRTGTALYRILSALHLRAPVFHDNGQDSRVTRMDAQPLAEQLQGLSVEIAYLDPPYNQHPYGSNYHVLNTLTLWDKPALGPATDPGAKAAIRADWRQARRSAYNHRATAAAAYATLLETLDARYILTSYSTDGTIPLPDLLASACLRGRTVCTQNAYKRYRVSAQRPSRKPLTVEFVLVTDTRHRGRLEDAADILTSLTRTETEALAGHPEAAIERPSRPLAFERAFGL